VLTGEIGGGMALALAAAAADTFAVVLTASEARRQPRSQGMRPRLLLSLARRPRWLLGTGLMVLEWPLQVAALALAPIAIVQPMLSTSQLGLLWLARTRLRESVGVRELAAVVAIFGGLAIMVAEAPHDTGAHVPALRLGIPIIVVGGIVLGCYGAGRARPRLGTLLVIAAGLSYAWIDFANKLLANALSAQSWLAATLWLLATLVFGALAFLEENSAMQQRAAITVAPVIGAIKEPVPVLMALWAGIESWGSNPARIIGLLIGLALVAGGASKLSRTQAVASLHA
jgi:hypothetical protein